MDLEKAYNPKAVEQNIYERWESSGFFNPDKLPGKRKKSFSISMPPPNVTGDLHLGHATGLTIEDIMTRWHRMTGDKTLFLPGTDHAGISTQIMVEKMIAKEGMNRHKLGRQQFLEKVWEWKEQYGSHITKQIRQLGASCDWSREHFTMDPKLTKAVQTAFIKLYNDGLIYRGNRIIHWCPHDRTALSDLEVKHQEEQGKMYFLRYPLFGTTKYLTVATTRPETMLGDEAVAVNPHDKRYSHLVGQKVLLPIKEKEIPIIADEQVDMNFGTGAVKVTPGHDPLDYEIGVRHKLPITSVIGFDGKMTKEAGEFFGQSIKACRENILRQLKEGEFVEKEQPYVHNVERCDRCGAVVEPLVSLQWFVKMKPLAERAIKAVRKKKIRIIPERFEKVYFHWMENIRDWCISRQLWWGHQIPIWYCKKPLHNCKPIASAEKPTQCPRCKTHEFIQDEDTLDTWFSSGLWTFSTLGWPEKTKDLKIFHPTSVMETGWDILFFWVSRMIMMSLYLLKEVPFRTVYLHGLVLDKDGKKMSKSKGTGIDPIPMTEKYGTDAIRLSLVLGTKPGQDFRLFEEKIAGYRNFINKLWNVARFVVSKDQGRAERAPSVHTLADKWIMSRLQTVVRELTEDLERFRFSEAGTRIYEFLWHEFADWYVEISKSEQNFGLALHALKTVLTLLHPFAPYVTEELWSRLGNVQDSTLLLIQPWPKSEKKLLDEKSEEQMAILQALIVRVRNDRKERNLSKETSVSLTVWGKNAGLVQQNGSWIKTMARLQGLQIVNNTDLKPDGSLEELQYAIITNQ